MKLSLAPMAAAVEDTPLLPNAKKKDLPTTDSKTTATKKGYSVVRLSVAFGTCAVVLLGVVVFCVDRGGGGDTINTNIVHNTSRSSGKEKLEYCALVNEDKGKARICHKGDEGEEDKCPGYPTDMQRGMCDTSGTYDHVLPFLNHQEVIPGRIYYGLDLKDDAYKHNEMTYTPHNPPMSGRLDFSDMCKWGAGKSVGRCIRDGYKPKSADVFCPSTQRLIVDGWQRCAELCNDQQDCLTFTVSTRRVLNHLDFHCFFSQLV